MTALRDPAGRAMRYPLFGAPAETSPEIFSQYTGGNDHMSQPKTAACLSVTDQAHLGRRLAMPGGWPYAWRVYDQVSASNAVTARAQLVPDAGSREALLAKGWTLGGGEFFKLFGRARGGRMASA
jgi:hypothetical protein